MPREKHVWQQADSAKFYLEDIRGAIPLAAEQLDVILRIVRKNFSRLDRILDLGCGDGILGRTLLADHPQAQAVFLDFSEHMIHSAKEKVDHPRATFFVGDFGEKNWAEPILKYTPFDLVISGLAIHHLLDKSKQTLYKQIFDLLKPGGMFLHLERVASKSSWAKDIFQEFFIDHLWSYHKQQGGVKTRDAVEQQYHNRPGRGVDLLATLELQCRWLEEIGFTDVECFFKIFEIVVFGGKKPLAD